MSPDPEQLEEPPAPPSGGVGRWLRRMLIGLAAVCGVYLGGFLWEEVSPAAYSVVFLIIASTPLLLKISFWKKLLMLFPLLLIRVIGKVLIQVFGLRFLEKLFRRYGLLEKRFKKVVAGFNDTRVGLVSRWNGISRQSQAHLILTFLPFLGLLIVGVVIIKILRFRILQLVVEKVMQKGVMSASERMALNKKKQTEVTEPESESPDEKT